MDVCANIRKKIQIKLNDYKKRDKKIIEKYGNPNNYKTITLNESISLLANINTCEICDCKLLFDIYEPWCLYQFSYDRINEMEIHHINNLRILCFDCNARHNTKELKLIKDDCIKKCHLKIKSI